MLSNKIRIRFLGTGTSIGVPQIGCQCDVCTSSDPRDRRLRASALFEACAEAAGGADTRILLDCGPDFREQMLRIGMCDPLDAVLITHEHYDHVGGIDDLRPFTFDRQLPLYADAYTCEHLRQRLPYCLINHSYPGIPQLQLKEIKEGDQMQIGSLQVTAIGVMHGKLPILGYRIGDVAYLTDMTELSPASLPLLQGIRLLIIGALRHTPHLTHQTVEHAIGFSRSLGDIPTYFIHMSHQVGLHAIEEEKLPAGFHYAYDGMVIEV